MAALLMVSPSSDDSGLTSCSSKSNTAILIGGDFWASAANAEKSVTLSNRTPIDPIADKVRVDLVPFSALTFTAGCMDISRRTPNESSQLLGICDPGARGTQFRQLAQPVAGGWYQIGRASCRERV